MSVPVVSFTDLRSTDPAIQQQVAEAIKTAFGHYGLIYIRDHGIEREQVLTSYASFLDVLERPEEEKATWGGPSIWYQRGWTPANTEQAVVAGGQPDFKECYFAAPMELDVSCASAWPEVYAPNVWPEKAPVFQTNMMELGQKIHAIGIALLGGCERALGLEAGEITQRCDGAPHVTRLLKYLPLSEDQTDSGILWGEEHTDFNLLTLLPGGSFYRDGEVSEGPEDAGGLWLRTRPTEAHPEGEMVRGKPPEGCIVAQVGQQFEVITAGRFTATPHVITAPKEEGWVRCSMAHFVHLHGRQLVEPLEPFRNDKEAVSYLPPVLAGTYAHKTLVDIGLAPPKSLDVLGYRHYDRLSEWRS